MLILLTSDWHRLCAADYPDWIEFEAALDWAMQTYRLPPGPAREQTQRAWDSKSLRRVCLCISTRDGKLLVVDTVKAFEPGGPWIVWDEQPVRHADEFKWQIKQQLGEPPESAPEQPKRGRTGVRTNKQANAEEAVKTYLRGLPEFPVRRKADVQKAAMADFEHLTAKAFKRAWGVAAHASWQKGGRRPRP